MKELTFIKLVDLDKSPCNKIVVEKSLNEDIKFFECPHHIVVGVIRIVSEVIRQARFEEEPAALQKSVDTVKVLEQYHESLMKELTSIKDEIRDLKLKFQ
jgi:hypothetical protein